MSPSQIKNVLVFGSGLMGRGIAQVSAASGYKVTLYDVQKEFLSKAYDGIHSSIRKVAAKKFPEAEGQAKEMVESTMSRISLTTSVEGPHASSADLVIEAIVENLSIKQELFQRLDSLVPKGAILTSNTSSLSIQAISQKCKKERLTNFAGLHFFNPVPIMKLVEIVKAPATSEATVKNLQEFSKSVGKVSVLCKDTPGFIVNRLLVPYLIEGIRMHERGDSSIKDIDTAMKLGAGYPMGPFELLDYVGLDTVKFILNAWNNAHPEVEAFKPSPMLNELVEKGHLGKKTGKGFYDYSSDSAKGKL